MLFQNIIDKKIGKESNYIAYGITSRTKDEADAERILKVNHGHWAIENCCHYTLNWNYDEDRSQIRTRYSLENMTKLRKFAIGLVKSKKSTRKSVA
jgi:predicted transposase YbfD/YdcC